MAAAVPMSRTVKHTDVLRVFGGRVPAERCMVELIAPAPRCHYIYRRPERTLALQPALETINATEPPPVHTCRDARRILQAASLEPER